MPVGEANLFGIHKYDNLTQFFDPAHPILSQASVHLVPAFAQPQQ